MNNSEKMDWMEYIQSLNVETVEVESMDFLSHQNLLRANGIVLNEENRYFVIQFLELFENYMNGATSGDGEKYPFPKFAVPANQAYVDAYRGRSKPSAVSQATAAIGSLNITKNIEHSVVDKSKKYINVPMYMQYMKANGIVFNATVKHHPHRFVSLFEYVVDGITAIEEGQKCLLFCLLVEMKDEWKKDSIYIGNYASLKSGFLAKYWSETIQKEALKYFENLISECKSTRELVTTYLEWFHTIRSMEVVIYEKVYKIDFMYHRLPFHLQAKVRDKDLNDLELFLQRIEKFAENCDDSEADKKDAKKKPEKSTHRQHNRRHGGSPSRHLESPS